MFCVWLRWTVFFNGGMVSPMMHGQAVVVSADAVPMGDNPRAAAKELSY